MKILITGTSRSGKSTIGKALQKLGYGFIEADVDTYNGKSIAYWTDKKTKRGRNIPWPPPENCFKENNWTWRVDVLDQLMTEVLLKKKIVFVCGDAFNKEEAYKLFDKIFVLTASDEMLRQRVKLKTHHDFGTRPAELTWILKENETYVEKMIKSGAIPVDTNKSVEDVINEILSVIKKS